MTDKTKSNTGISALGLLQVIFIACKAAEVTAIAQWSWWLVFSPMLFTLGFVVAVLLIALIYAVIKD